MREIAAIDELKTVQERLRKFISFPEPFPMFNFRVQPKKFWFFDYHYVFEAEFFSILAEYCKAIGESGFSYITIDPDPVYAINPAYKYYNTFASVKFTVGDDPDSLGDFLAKEREVKESNTYNIRDYPGKTESIITTLSAYGMLSNSSSWVIYGEYGLDISVLATFVDSEANTSLFLPPYFMSIEDVVDWIKALGPKYCTIDPEAFRRSWQEQKLLP